MSVCSAHREVVPGCSACVATPAMVLGITEAEWNYKLAEAEARGLAPCRCCGFVQYKNHRYCTSCGVVKWEGDQ